jgi:hypothetical protein
MSITKISPSVVDFDAGITISTTDNTSNLILTSTDADANVGPVLELYRNSSSPADNDELARIYFYGENDNDEKIEYGLIRATIVDASDGTEDSLMQFLTYTGGGQKSRIELLATETVFNEGSSDIDFRVESDNDTHALFVQGSNGAVGIGVSDPGGLPLHLKVASGDNKLRMETAAKDAFVMEFENSTGDLKLGTNTNAGSFVVKDGGNVSITDGNLIVASGHGIDFAASANASGAASHLLDDYEEGTWTPDLIGCDDNLSSPTGHYTKIGRLVYFYWYSGAFTISNQSGVAL